MSGMMIKRDVPFSLYEVDILGATDEQLSQVSADMSLSLSLEEMKTIRDYFKKEGRNPTDIELQSLGQAWSEHCCYKSSKPILKEFVFGIDRDDVLSRGDAGVMVFDDDYGYCPLYVKQSLEDEYKQYHTLKGNGVGTQIYHALMELPTEPPHEGEE